MAPYKTCNVFFFLLFWGFFTLESVATVGVHGLEFFPCVKIQNSDVDQKMTPEPPSTEWWVTNENSLFNTGLHFGVFTTNSQTFLSAFKSKRCTAGSGCRSSGRVCPFRQLPHQPATRFPSVPHNHKQTNKQGEHFFWDPFICVQTKVHLTTNWPWCSFTGCCYEYKYGFCRI